MLPYTNDQATVQPTEILSSALEGDVWLILVDHSYNNVTSMQLYFIGGFVLFVSFFLLYLVEIGFVPFVAYAIFLYPKINETTCICT